MRRHLATSALLVAPLSAAGQAGAPGPLNVAAAPYSAKPDAVWGVTDCTIAAGSTSLTCAGESFASGDVGKTLILDDGNGAGKPLVTTIAGTTASPHTVTIATAPSQALPLTTVPVLQADGSNQGSGYIFGSTQTLSCGANCVLAPLGTPGVMVVVSAAIMAGNGGQNNAPGPCQVTLPGQGALPNQSTIIGFTILSSGVADRTSVGIVRPGLATSDNASSSGGAYLHQAASGACGTLSGGGTVVPPTLTIRYGIVQEQVTRPGAFTKNVPCSATISAGATGVPGTGAKFFCPGTYSSTTAWGTDNTPAFQQALADANAYAYFSNPRPITVPAGNYLLQPLNQKGASGSVGTCSTNGSACVPMCNLGAGCSNTCGTNGTCSAGLALGYGAWIGDEHNHSNLFVVPASANIGPPQDVFGWLRTDQNGSQPALGNTQTFSDSQNKNQEGSAVRNLTIIGNRGSQTQQNALSFYSYASSVLVDNLTVSYMRGHAFGAGYNASANANLIESRLINSTFDHDGDSGSSNPVAPVLDIGANKAEGSNNLDLTNLAITAPFGPGLAIHAASLPSGKGGPRQIRLTNVRIEGTNQSLQAPPISAPADLLLLDASNLGTQSIRDITCRNLQLVNPVLGAAALHVATAGTLSGTVNNIDCEGSIGSEPSALLGGTVIADLGRGAVIEGCQQCKLTFVANTAQDYQLVAGTFTPGGPPTCAGPGGQPALSSPGLIYDGAGAESALTTCLDPLSLNLLAFPNRQVLANGSLANTSPPAPIEQITSSVSGTGTTLTVTGTAPVVSISVAAPLWTVTHTGSASATFTDTLDSAANIIAAINASSGSTSFASAGQLYRLRYCNQTTQSATLAPGTGISGPNGGSFTVAAGSCISLVLNITSLTPPAITIAGG